MKSPILLILGLLFISFHLIGADSDRELKYDSFFISNPKASCNFEILVPDILRESYDKKENGYRIKCQDKTTSVSVTFMLPNRIITLDSIKKLIEISASIATSHEDIVEIKGKRFSGYSVVFQNEALKRMGQYCTEAKFIIDGIIVVSVHVTGENKNKNKQLVDDVSTSLEKIDYKNVH